MRFSTWLRVLGENWTTCDNISEHLVDLFLQLEGLSGVPQMMTRAERRRFASLPGVVVIYCGCGEANINGACWSVSKETAERFPFLNRYRTAVPLLVTATVEKQDILALKHDRSEDEIITLDPNIINVEPISQGREAELFAETNSLPTLKQ